MTDPGVRIPPPAVFIVTLVVSWVLQKYVPLPFIAHDTALWVGLAVVAVGLAIALMSVVTMLRGHGTVNTHAASNALVVSGIYRISRNPMYVSNVLIYTGFASAMGLPWGLILLPLPVLYTQVAVIAREERFLASAFGQQYTDYKARVRRWL
jgi:protein-S-isoprenylcysteine O-methyltransferase Ste14